MLFRSGSIASGGAVLAAQAMGADFAYIGSAFIATEEARASQAYKQCVVDSNSDDIVYSSLFTGVHGNYLKPSIRAAGLDPDHLPESDPSAMNFGGDANAKYVVGPRAIAKLVGANQPATGGSTLSWSCETPIVASSGDLGVSIGFIRQNTGGGAPTPFFTIWRKVNKVWKYIAE